MRRELLASGISSDATCFVLTQVPVEAPCAYNSSQKPSQSGWRARKKPPRGRLLNLESGCRSRTRTYDPLINSQLLYLLSYAATRDTIIPLSIGAMSHGT